VIFETKNHSRDLFLKDSESRGVIYTMKQVKVLITGPYRAGKSSLIRLMANGNSLSIDKHGTTVCMDYGNVDVDGVRLHLFGTPGQERFAIIRNILSEGMKILVMVLDSTMPDSVRQAKAILAELGAANIPCIIAANKQDCPQAMSPNDVRRAINVPGVPIVGSSAMSRKGAEELLSQIYQVALRVQPSLPS
jgi:small GTP-binding protein